MATVQAALHSHSDYVVDCRVMQASSEERWMAVHGRGIYADDGSILGMTGVVQDITDRKRSEEAARVGEQHLRAALDALSLHHQCLQTLSARLLETQERERRAVAHELHEEVCQALAAIKMNLQSLQQRSPAPQLDACMHIVDGVLQRVRDLSVDLLPPQLSDLGLGAAVASLIARRSGPNLAQIEFHDTIASPRLHPELETTCFRVIQEALANADRHADASHVWIVLAKHSDELQLTIADDGKGFDVLAAHERVAGSGTSGLTAMLERVRLARGHMEISSSSRLGTEIIVTLSLSPARPPSRTPSGELEQGS